MLSKVDYITASTYKSTETIFFGLSVYNRNSTLFLLTSSAASFCLHFSLATVAAEFFCY